MRAEAAAYTFSPSADPISMFAADGGGGGVMITVERIGWSIARKRYVRFRLTYSHMFLAERNLWRDFLVGTEELELL